MQNDIKGFLHSMADSAARQVTLESVYPAVKEIFIDLAADSSKLNKELGKANKSAISLKKTISNLSKETGVSTNRFVEIIKTSSQYHKLLDTHLNKSIALFAEGTSSSAVATTELISRLTILNKEYENSDSNTKDLLKTISHMQEQMGLTRYQVELLQESMTKYSSVVSSASSNMLSATRNASVFMSALTGVGMSGDSVKNLMDSLLDPSRVSEMLPLWSRLGISIADISSGEAFSKLQASLPKLKKLADEIAKEGNMFRREALANVYQLDLEQVSLLSKLSIEKIEEASNKTLEEYRRETLTLMDSLGAGKNQIAASIVSLGTNVYQFVNEGMDGLLDNIIRNPAVFTTGALVFGMALDKFLRKKFALWGGNFGNAIVEGSGLKTLLKESSSRVATKESDAFQAESAFDLKQNPIFQDDKKRFLGRRKGTKAFNVFHGESRKDHTGKFDKAGKRVTTNQDVFDAIKEMEKSEAEFEEIIKYAETKPQTSYWKEIKSGLIDRQRNITEEKYEIVRLLSETFQFDSAQSEISIAIAKKQEAIDELKGKTSKRSVKNRLMLQNELDALNAKKDREFGAGAITKEQVDELKGAERDLDAINSKKGDLSKDDLANKKELEAKVSGLKRLIDAEEKRINALMNDPKRIESQIDRARKEIDLIVESGGAATRAQVDRKEKLKEEIKASEKELERAKERAKKFSTGELDKKTGKVGSLIKEQQEGARNLLGSGGDTIASKIASKSKGIFSTGLKVSGLIGGVGIANRLLTLVGNYLSENTEIMSMVSNVLGGITTFILKPLAKFLEPIFGEIEKTAKRLGVIDKTTEEIKAQGEKEEESDYLKTIDITRFQMSEQSKISMENKLLREELKKIGTKIDENKEVNLLTADSNGVLAQDVVTRRMA